MAFEGQKQYKEATAHVTGNTLNGLAAVRRDADSAVAADGQYEPLHTNATGRLKVSTHNGAFETATGTITAAGQTVAADVTRAGSAVISIYGTYAINATLVFEAYDGVNWLPILAQPTNLQPAVTGSGTLAANATAAWNVSPLLGFTQVRVRSGAIASGTMNVRITPSVQAPALAPAGGSITGTLSTVTTVGTITNGGLAHDAVDSGSPHKVGGQARTTNPVAVADADRTNFIADKLGKQVVVGSIRDLKVQQATTITNSTTETPILTAVAATFLDVYGLIISNTSATVCSVAIKDATAGTTRLNVSVLPGDTFTFMVPESGAMTQAAVNTSWTATCSAAVTSITVTALAVRNI